MYGSAIRAPRPGMPAVTLSLSIQAVASLAGDESDAPVPQRRRPGPPRLARCHAPAAASQALLLTRWIYLRRLAFHLA
jgi:hypothetical protein